MQITSGSGVEKLRKTGRELVATLPGFGNCLREHVVDEVLIALPVSSYYSQFSSILLACDKWMELDMPYIDRWSLWRDLKILASTLPAVVSGKAAT